MVVDITVTGYGKKEAFAGIGTKSVKLYVEKNKKEHLVSFKFPEASKTIVRGRDVRMKKAQLEWKFDWQLNTTYKLMLATATDTAEKFSIVSAYIFLPAEQKWKLIGTCRMKDEVRPLEDLKAVRSTGKASRMDVSFSNVMVQTARGWRRLDDTKQPVPSPAVPPLANVDSVYQVQADKDLIDVATGLGAIKAKENIEGVYYEIINPGSGTSFTAKDSVSVRYQLRLLGSQEVISGSETEQYTFMLGSLIRGWQLAVPLVKTGGKIRLVIPSGMAYSIRTRSPKIPPNSVLVFDIDVLDAKPAAK